MLSLSKKTDYALIALAFLVEHPERTASAREIAETYNLPTALLMNLMKQLQHAGMITSARGPKGGYKLAVAPRAVSLLDVIRIIDGEPAIVQCAEGCPPSDDDCKVHDCPVQSPLKALHHRLIGFLAQVKLSDLVVNGTKIDVPREAVGVGAGVAVPA